MEGSWRMIEVVGSSRDSIQAAVRAAVATAGVANAKWFEVREIRGLINDGAVEFQVRLAIGHEIG